VSRFKAQTRRREPISLWGANSVSGLHGISAAVLETVMLASAIRTTLPRRLSMTQPPVTLIKVVILIEPCKGIFSQLPDNNRFHTLRAGAFSRDTNLRLHKATVNFLSFCTSQADRPHPLEGTQFDPRLEPVKATVPPIN
jgi:hypothetical protein